MSSAPIPPSYTLLSPAPVHLLVGVFDSGVGGLSVLSALRERLPQHPMLYVADSAHAPYGERTDAFVAERTERVAEHLVEQGAGLLVVACNTATAVAVDTLRARWPALPVVGVEPGIKPAVKLSATGRIGVMATPATLRSDKFNRLLQAHRGAAEIILQPCPGLAKLIEQGRLDDPALLTLIDAFCAPLRDAQVDTVVLGCTHYPFVRKAIQAALGAGVQLIDTAAPVAQQAWRLLGSPGAGHEPAVPGLIRLQTTGNVAHLNEVASHWLDFTAHIGSAPTR